MDKHELYSWNYDGSLSSITYPSGRVVNYAVGNAERATSATDGSGYQYAAPQGGSWPEYAAFGPLETMLNGAVPGGFAGIANYSTWANGIPRPVLYGESAVVGGSYIMNYANFPMNNLNFEAVWDDMNLNRSQTYTYDYLQRLTSAVTTGTSGGDCWGQGFGSGGNAYDDRYSNMSQMTVSQCSAGSLDEAITTSTNQFTGFAYDSSGNETGGIGTQTYDAENRMTTSGYPGFTLTNAFDALNLKITKTRSDGLYPKMYWRDIWGNTLSESDSSGHMLNDYIYFAGKRIAYVTNTGSTYFYLTDQIGSVRKIADQNGVVCYDADYTPYGQQIYVAANSCPAQPYLFAGMERDDNAFDYDFARYYSSRLGRFMSADPLGGNINNPQSLNRYTYVLNDPINLVDPRGLTVCTSSNPSQCEWPNLGANLEWNGADPDPGNGSSSNGTSPPGLDGTDGGGNGGGGGDGGKNNNKCPSGIRQAVNLAMLALNLPVQLAEGEVLAQTTGDVVQIGVSAQGAVQFSSSVVGAGGQASVALAFDPVGNIALTSSVGGFAGFGAGGIAGVTLSFSHGPTVFSLQGSSGFGGIGGADEFGGSIEGSTNGGGTISLTAGVGAGGIATTGGAGQTNVTLLVCHQ